MTRIPTLVVMANPPALAGGCSVHALDKVRKQADNEYPDFETDREDYRDWHDYWHNFAEKNLFGIEINEQIARTAKMNMIIHDDGHTNVVASDGLLTAETIAEKSENKGFKNESFDFIITNPPFGSAIKLTEQAYLKNYRLAHNEPSWLDLKNTAVKGRDSQSTEVLFIEQAHNFLKVGGYLAIVIPDGILTNSSLQSVRDDIEEHFRIVAVVSMPQTAFSATGAGVKSSVLFLKKYSEQETDHIQKTKIHLQNNIKYENLYEKFVMDIEKEKALKVKNLTGFDNPYREDMPLKLLKATEEYKEWKSELDAEYRKKINEFKEKLEDLYLQQKQQKLPDYPIFMAIAEDIGYDATGKNTKTNELDFIGQELAKFILEVEQDDKMGKFNLNQNIDTDKIFIVYKSQIDGRLEPKFYTSKYLGNLEKLYTSQFNIVSLNKVTLLISDGTHFTPVYVDEGVKFISVKDVRRGKIDFENTKFITEEEANLLDKRCKPQLDDVLLTKIGTFGFASVITTNERFQIFVSVALLRPKQDLILPQYLEILLNSDFSYIQYDRVIKGAGVPDLHLEDIRKILIPLPSLDIQDKIIESHQNYLLKSSEKIKKAKDLLESINQYLLDELGIELPQQDNSLKSRIFIRKSSEIIGGKFDANSYRTYYKELKFAIKNTHYTTSKLYDLVGIGCGGNWGSDLIDDYDAEKFVISTVIRATEFDNQGNLNFIPDKVKKRLISKNIFDKINLQLNDLIIEKSGGSENQPVGRIAIIDEDAVSKGFLIHSNFIHKISVTSNLVYPDYLFYFLKLTHFIKLTESMQSQTNGIRNLIMSEYLAQTIIIPSLDKQQEIVTHIQNLRHQAKQLEQDAEQILADAKREIERVVLGE